MSQIDSLGSAYGSLRDADFVPRYRASCHCGRVTVEAQADPVDAKICHCRDCQKLHGAPMQWAAIFEKRDIRLTSGGEHLRFFNASSGNEERVLPCKVSCRWCGTPIADEGRNMWLAFPTLFEFGAAGVPESFKPTCHIFYAVRCVDINDGLPKWSGHKNQSELLHQ